MTLDRDLVAAALPNYEVDGEIGRGGWGVVLHGRHMTLGREVAIKQLPGALASGDSALDRFVNEARIVAQLDHPHIMKVYDFVEHDGLWLMVMEYLSGGTLWNRFREQGLRSDQACAVVMGVCAGLDAANGQGVLHRDIKPENILFTHDGVPRLGDFGIAKDLETDTRRTRVGEVVGTPTYMSPEQAVGEELTRACDVYSLAVVLYELLSGRLPFEEARTPTEQLIQHATAPPLPLAQTAPDVPTVIADVVLDALEKRPENRIATPQALGVALARAACETFGPGWLQQSGVPLMGGGRIQAAALRGPTMGAPVVAPTMAVPVLRADHFRLDDSAYEGLAALASPPESNVDPEATVATAATIGPRDDVPATDHAGATPPSPTPPSPTTPSPTPPSPTTPSPKSASETVVARVAPPPSDRRSLWPLLVGGAFVAAVIVIVLVVALSGGGGDGAITEADQTTPAATSPQTTLATTPPTTVAATPSTIPATTAPVVVPPVTEPPVTEPPVTEPPVTEVPTTTAGETMPEHVCPEAARCTFIDSIVVDGDSVVVEWTAIGFEPSYQEGFVHAHFFWDIYSADQVGTNAATFGVAQGAWEVTDQQPFRSQGELLVRNRPVPANQICVTAANFAHAVVNPLQFDCIPIPEGM
jgi:serine/threonine-protein kinase